VELTSVTDDVRAWLSAEERERAARFLDERRGLLWARSRGALRALLGRYLGVHPAGLRFGVAPQGKPVLREPGSSSGLAFNLSHSGHLALFAFTISGSIGVDVEIARRRTGDAAIVRRVFGRTEARRLQRLSPAARERALLAAWTRHEAVLKWRGARLLDYRSSAGDRDDEMTGGAKTPAPWVADLDVGGQAAGAVAADIRPEHFARWEWRETIWRPRCGRERCG
jgi:4'-phosphopantetheinyl transferase